MITARRIIVLLLLVLIVVLSAWSRLHYVDDSDFAPQRMRMDEHPAFQKHPPDGG
jgi:hypothetical protein